MSSSECLLWSVFQELSTRLLFIYHFVWCVLRAMADMASLLVFHCGLCAVVGSFNLPFPVVHILSNLWWAGCVSMPIICVMWPAKTGQNEWVWLQTMFHGLALCLVGTVPFITVVASEDVVSLSCVTVHCNWERDWPFSKRILNLRCLWSHCQQPWWLHRRLNMYFVMCPKRGEGQTIHGLPCTKLGSELCVTIFGLSGMHKSLDCIQGSVQSKDYNWSSQTEPGKGQWSHVFLKLCQPWLVIVHSNSAHTRSTSIAGMAPDKKDFTPSAWILLRTLLLTFFVEGSFYLPATNASWWAIIRSAYTCEYIWYCVGEHLDNPWISWA